MTDEQHNPHGGDTQTQEAGNSDFWAKEMALITRKMEIGHFWFKEGAIADATRLAREMLRERNVTGTLLLMIDVHEKAAASAKRQSETGEKSISFCRQQYEKSRRALWLYKPLYKIWRIVLFFGSL